MSERQAVLITSASNENGSIGSAEAITSPAPVPQGFPYPQGLIRAVLRLPILIYRMGLGRVYGLVPLLILTTRGRRSGQPRYAALEFRRHGSKFYVVSMWGEHPQWYQNLLASPLAALRYGKERHNVRAAMVDDPHEALRVLNLFRKTAPAIYDPLITRLSAETNISPRKLPDISHQFTIVRLDPIPDENVKPFAPPPLPSNLAWVMPVVLLFALMLVVKAVLTRTRRSD